MDRDQAIALVSTALDALFEEDRDLPISIAERAATHRLAVHLEKALEGLQLLDSDGKRWSVDCEYNRMGTVEPKELHVLASKLARGRSAEELIASDVARTVFPDIVVHRRGEAGPNVLVIEVKRAGAASTDVNLDKAKLVMCLRELGYINAILVTLGADRASCRIDPVTDDGASPAVE